ncbi:MAG: replication protein [Desulfovibrionaceae bacterium]
MACPQKENGFAPLANELLEALARAQLSGRERRIIDVVLRQTYGWSRKSARIANADYAARTGLTKKACSELVNGLADKGVLLVERSGPRAHAVVALNKDYEQWRGLEGTPNNGDIPKKRDTPKGGDIPEKRDKVSPNTGIRGIPENGETSIKEKKEKKERQNHLPHEGIPKYGDTHENGDRQKAKEAGEWERLGQEEREAWMRKAWETNGVQGGHFDPHYSVHMSMGKRLWLREGAAPVRTETERSGAWRQEAV